MKVKYYKDADLLSLRVSKKPYFDATRNGNLVVHYTKNGQPVLVEILNASKFLNESDKSSKALYKSLAEEASVAITHRIK